MQTQARQLKGECMLYLRDILPALIEPINQNKNHTSLNNSKRKEQKKNAREWKAKSTIKQV